MSREGGMTRSITTTIWYLLYWAVRAAERHLGFATSRPTFVPRVVTAPAPSLPARYSVLTE